jgi:hypothetical protein
VKTKWPFPVSLIFSAEFVFELLLIVGRSLCNSYPTLSLWGQRCTVINAVRQNSNSLQKVEYLEKKQINPTGRMLTPFVERRRCFPLKPQARRRRLGIHSARNFQQVSASVVLNSSPRILRLGSELFLSVISVPRRPEPSENRITSPKLRPERRFHTASSYTS